jgi:hypothetical protein
LVFDGFLKDFGFLVGGGFLAVFRLFGGVVVFRWVGGFLMDFDFLVV